MCCVSCVPFVATSALNISLWQAAFDKISDQPTSAIVYTHFHYDHINGSIVFADNSKVWREKTSLTTHSLQSTDPKVVPEVYSHASLVTELKRFMKLGVCSRIVVLLILWQRINSKRSMRQFGVHLLPEVSHLSECCCLALCLFCVRLLPTMMVRNGRFHSCGFEFPGPQLERTGTASRH